MFNLKRVTLALFLTAAVALQTIAAELGTQESSDRGVTVAVTPQTLASNASTWNFKIVLDTHSADLSDDLVKSAVLLDEKGGRHAPIAWDGAAPGGHHREGVLRFKPIAPQPRSIELQIRRGGEAAPRSFRWQIN